MRDVDNLRNFFGRYAPALLGTQYGPEVWALFAAGVLKPDTALDWPS
jgi:RIO kinase 1